MFELLEEFNVFSFFRYLNKRTSTFVWKSTKLALKEHACFIPIAALCKQKHAV